MRVRLRSHIEYINSIGDPYAPFDLESDISRMSLIFRSIHYHHHLIVSENTRFLVVSSIRKLESSSLFLSFLSLIKLILPHSIFHSELSTVEWLPLQSNQSTRKLSICLCSHSDSRSPYFLSRHNTLWTLHPLLL